jgi:hypothetical protein
MIRMTLIAAAACLPLSLASLPTQAAVGLYTPDAVVTDSAAQQADHFVLKCRWKRVYVNGYWKRKKVCKKVWPAHKKSYNY